MSRSRFPKLWQSLRHRCKRDEKKGTLSPTIGNGQLPIEVLQEIFSNFDMWTLMRCCSVCRLWNQCIPGDSPSLRMAMYLPASKHNISGYKTTAINALKFNFGVTLHGDFARLQENWTRKPQLVTDYTVRLRSFEKQRLQEYNITLNPILLCDMKQLQLRQYKASWTSVGNAKPLWMTMLVCQPPVKRLTIHFEFLDTHLILEECIQLSHTTSRTLVNPTGIVLGDMLSATYDSMWWEEMRLSRTGGYCPVSAYLLPSTEQEIWGMDEGPPVSDQELPVLCEEPTPVPEEEPMDRSR
jgi:hypothetical protein